MTPLRSVFLSALSLATSRTGSAAMSLPFKQDEVTKIIEAVGADNLTAKKVREELEAKLGVESGEFKQYKQQISNMIDEAMKVRPSTHASRAARAALASAVLSIF